MILFHRRIFELEHISSHWEDLRILTIHCLLWQIDQKYLILRINLKKFVLGLHIAYACILLRCFLYICTLQLLKKAFLPRKYHENFFFYTLNVHFGRKNRRLWVALRKIFSSVRLSVLIIEILATISVH